MLLFSTILDIVPTMTKRQFVDLVIEWNNTNRYQYNIIPGLKWDGEKNVRFGDDKLWLEIVDHEDMDIMAVRYEKVQEDEVVWDTDYIMNFHDMKLAVTLERSYKAETVITNAGFSTPHFISILINAGVLANDNGLDVMNTPLEIHSGNTDIIADIVNRKKSYALPVIYVSSLKKKLLSADSETYPVDVRWLASRLKGVAHVLVETDDLHEELRGMRCDHGGDIGIYFTSGSYLHKIRRYKKGSKRREESLEKIVDLLIKHMTIRHPEKLYTWHGVNNSVLLDILAAQSERMEVVEKERDKIQSENADIYDAFDEEFAMLNKKIEDLTKTNEKLMAETYAMSSQIASDKDKPVIYYGTEREMYSGEIRDYVLSVLSEAYKNTKPGTRKSDVLKDILEKNNYQQLGKSRREEVKKIFNGYKNVSAAIRGELERLGFTLTEEGKHYKALYHGDPRYMITIAKTPSDNRTGMNVAHSIGETAF